MAHGLRGDNGCWLASINGCSVDRPLGLLRIAGITVLIRKGLRYEETEDIAVNQTDEVVEDGYEFFAKRQLVTLFSAPNYCGEFDNAGSMMTVDETLMCSFQVCFVTHKYRQSF
ncbi:hypothetical protein ANCDUO_25481 [Ancylostoma duodenale]|uniref:protein-serine/threonine phosphatase n=1 Tax=Ancylostoma duodenale TaxID=51022 RepID=A0A0C2BL45_9BILA|nr:hypothetical protein ANCDUO_25481 [Ancylostoma duodenale]